MDLSYCWESVDYSIELLLGERGFMFGVLLLVLSFELLLGERGLFFRWLGFMFGVLLLGLGALSGLDALLRRLMRPYLSALSGLDALLGHLDAFDALLALLRPYLGALCWALCFMFGVLSYCWESGFYVWCFIIGVGFELLLGERIFVAQLATCKRIELL